MHLFPESGFDQNATTPVFLGVLVTWFFTETFGWVFGGLVVPGYLATIFLLDPRSASIDVGEAALTYLGARALGEHLSRTGLTSRLFGRERFFLVLLVSVLVRVGVEGIALTRFLPHTSWAYSLGLVIVPLTANACWKTGLLQGALQKGVPTLVVYTMLALVLVPHTNLSLAGFRLATENIAGSFLSSPKAYFLLLTTALLAAGANVRWGWDYNGILIPALLSLVIASPVKLAATATEVVLIVLVVRGLLRFTPLGRLNIEGPRRSVLFFAVDYWLRFGLALVVGRSLPGSDVLELTGLGYLLPTLLAVKVAQKGSFSLVLLPTATVSAAGFVLANGVGFTAERWFDEPAVDREQVTRTLGHPPRGVIQAALWVSALARPSAPRGRLDVLAPATVARVVAALERGAEPKLPATLELERLVDGVVVLRERFEDPERRQGEPAVLVGRGASGDEPLVLVVPSPLRAPEAAALGAALVTAHAAEALTIAGIEDDPRAVPGGPSAHATARAVAGALRGAGAALAARHGIVAGIHPSLDDAWHVGLSERASGSPRVSAFRRALGAVALESEPPPSGEDFAVYVPPTGVDAWLDRSFQGGAWATSTALAVSLDGLEQSVTEPSVEDLLALERLLLGPLLGAEPTPRSRAILAASASALGFDLVGPSPLPDGTDAVLLRPGAKAAPVGVLARTSGVRGLVVEVQHGGANRLARLGLLLGERLHADAMIFGTETRGGVLGNRALAAARAAATWPRPARSAELLLVRGAPADADHEVQATLGTWGGSTGGNLRSRASEALTSLALTSVDTPLTATAREEAGQTLLGRTPLVEVTIHSARLARSLTGTDWPLQTFAGLPVLDLELSRACLALAQALDRTRPLAADNVLEVARAAARERSVVARRELLRSLADERARAALVRASNGIFLLAVAETARGLAFEAVPVALATAEVDAAPRVRASAAGCAEALAGGGRCLVVASP